MLEQSDSRCHQGDLADAGQFAGGDRVVADGDAGRADCAAEEGERRAGWYRPPVGTVRRWG